MASKAAAAKPAAAPAKAAAADKKVAVAPATAAARPLVAVHSGSGAATKETVKMPHVLLAPIRPDIVHAVHTSMSKNRRQAYAVSYNTGMQHSAESWGTGRAVARIPRISGGGTSRAGQAAFGNQVRGGRMFAPTKIWRKWHRKINQNQKRFAVASALAASAITSLVMARGHRVDGIPEVPLVLTSDTESIAKTKQAVAVLKAVNAYGDVEKAKESRKLRAGVGKMRNRRHVQRRGPLVVFNEDKGITQAFRNLPGVELCQVDRLNLLQLAPGGHLGRFVIWTKAAFAKLESIWGSSDRVSASKNGYTLPRPIMLQSDLTRLINSDEVQSKVRPAIKSIKRSKLKKNPLNNLGALVTLNPYALALRRSELLTSNRRAAARKAAVEAKRKGAKVVLSKNAAEQDAAERKADKKHRATMAKNYARLSGAGNADRKPVVVEEPVQKPKAFVPKPGSKAAAAADAKAKETAAAKPAAAAPAPAKAAAPAADKKAAAPAADKKADAKKADGKKDDAKKGGDKKADAKKGGDKKGDAKKDAKKN